MDELHVIFTAYEMRKIQKNSITKENNFKASKKTKKKNKKNSKSSCSCSDYSDEYEEMNNFVRKLKKGTDTYKGMLPLKCFNCGGIGHFILKFIIIIKKTMNTNLIKGKINIKRETREETKGNYSIKFSTQRRKIPHQTRRIMTLIVI
jgi:hypothetical protein